MPAEGLGSDGVGESSTPVRVTVCAVLQSLDVKVSTAGITVPSAVSELATSSSTSPVGSLSSFTVNVAVPPDSVVRSRLVVDVAGDTETPAVSSSLRVRVAADGCATPLPPAAVPDTVTDLFAASTSLPFAVTATVPALVVVPAARVRVVAVLRAKSPDTAGETAAAATVTVTASLDGPDKVAVTVEIPPVSEIEVGVRTSATVGRVSSSSRVRVAFGGSATPLPPAAVPDTVTSLFGESTVLPFAVTVTTPALTVAPAAIVSVVAVLRVKSSTTAPAPAAAATVTATASLDGPDKVAVTVEIPFVSEIEVDVRTSAAVGKASSSVSVSVTLGGFETPLPPAAAPETVTDLFGESTSLPFAVTVTRPVLAVALAAKVSVAAVLKVKSPTTAPAPAAAATVTVTASLDGPESVAVTVETPPVSVIDEAESASATVGKASSSSKVNVTFGGFATLLPPAAVPETVTDLFGESTSLPFAVTVTTPALVVDPATKVSVAAVLKVKSAATAPAPAAAATVTVTASLDGPDKVAVTVETPPVSVTDEDDNTSATVGNVSSSVRVSVTFGGFATLLPPAAVPETVTDLLGESTSLPFAVTVTAPALVVRPAAMVRVVAVLRVKSSTTAPAPAAAATVTVTASLDGPESVAVTVEIPPVSEIEVEESASATVGRVSSSVRASAAPVTAPAPWPFASAAVTVTLRPVEPWWTASSTAVTNTVSEAAVVDPAAIVIVASVPTV